MSGWDDLTLLGEPVYPPFWRWFRRASGVALVLIPLATAAGIIYGIYLSSVYHP